MLISALCDYYDDLARDGNVVPEGYTSEKISWIVVLKADGTIDSIIDYRLPGEKARSVLMPSREGKPATRPEYIEHRFKYIFGYKYLKNQLTIDNNACQSHHKFAKQTLEWIEGLDSPIVNAYRNFIQKWEPEKETNNELVLSIAKKANNQSDMNCIFALENDDNHYLHEDGQVRAKWKEIRQKRESSTETINGQCAITGKKDCCISKLHTQLRLQSGVSLICYNNKPECSYGNENAYNSNISVAAMKKYTYALDYLLHNKENTQSLDDITIVFWATEDNQFDLLNILFESSYVMDRNETEKALKTIVKKAQKGELIEKKLKLFDNIKEDVTYYILGLMMVNGRLSVKFFYRRRLGELFRSIAYHQFDMQMGDSYRLIFLNQLKKELISPRRRKEKADTTIMTSVLKSIFHNSPYPIGFFSKMMIRIKNDRKINSIRAGALKAYFNRKSRLLKQKEEFQMSLDMSNTNPNYLCGRLFAVLEKIQEKSQGDKSESKTIRDSFFSAAASMPSTVFPNLIKKAQYHLNKLEPKYEAFYSKQLGEIIDMLDVEFPSYASTEDQGRFMLGYYQQREYFFNKKNKEDKNNGTQE
ncbi:MAG: type I-C CRISPR-associated protein Cas8c/Csd1 [Ruminococcus sp.]|nr:type I-C CRISPR-associated protein Cas8c/Csd1 [Ruminococcus sp.]